jgi:hypothetical protein
MDFLNGASDNEIAVIGCLAAMVGSLGLMFISGAVFRTSQTRVDANSRVGRVRGEVSRQVRPRVSEQEAA